MAEFQKNLKADTSKAEFKPKVHIAYKSIKYKK